MGLLLTQSALLHVLLAMRGHLLPVWVQQIALAASLVHIILLMGVCHFLTVLHALRGPYRKVEHHLVHRQIRERLCRTFIQRHRHNAQMERLIPLLAL